MANEANSLGVAKRPSILAILIGTVAVAFGCVPAYAENDPAVLKADAITEDAGIVGDLIRTAKATLADPDATPEEIQRAREDLDFAYMLSRTIGIVGRSLRRDLLNLEPDDNTDTEQDE